MHLTALAPSGLPIKNKNTRRPTADGHSASIKWPSNDPWPEVRAGVCTATGELDCTLPSRTLRRSAVHRRQTPLAHRASSPALTRVGWAMLFVVMDEHARITFTARHPEDKVPHPAQSLLGTLAYYAGPSNTVAAYRSTTALHYAPTNSPCRDSTHQGTTS